MPNQCRGRDRTARPSVRRSVQAGLHTCPERARTEDGMQPHDIIDTASPRYGFDPKLPFAATLAGAERRREAAVAAARVRPGRRSPWRLLRRLTTRVAISPS